MDQSDVQRNAVFPDMVGISVKHCFILHPVLERHVSQPCTHNSALFTGRLSLILYAADEAIAGGGRIRARSYHRPVWDRRCRRSDRAIAPHRRGWRGAATRRKSLAAHQPGRCGAIALRSEEQTSEIQSLKRNSY